MTQQVIVKASEGQDAFGELLERVNADEHLIVEQDGALVAVIMSYHEYKQLSQLRAELNEPTSVYLPPPRTTLEDTFGAVTPLNRPEDFAALRETAIDEVVDRAMKKMKGG
jgi:prevent-host-death family protein